MQILGDARPFTFQRALLLGQQQAALEFALLYHADGQSHASQYRCRSERNEPPRFVEVCDDEVIEGRADGHVAEDPAVAATDVAQVDFIKGGIRSKLCREDFELVRIGRATR